MVRRFTFITVALAAIVAFLVGAIFAGGFARPNVSAGSPPPRAATSTHIASASAPGINSLVNFADVVERINPSVVNIDATTRGHDGRRRRGRIGAPDSPDPPDTPFDFGSPRLDRGDTPHRG